MQFRLALAFCLAATIACADEATDAAIAFMSTCAAQFPDMRGTTSILKEQGWNYYGTNGSFHIYGSRTDRVIAATSTNGGPQKGCFTAIRKLTDEGATNLGSAVARSLQFLPASTEDLKEARTGEPSVVALWVGRLNGIDVALASMKPKDFYVLRGASIILIEQ